jgi:F-type H+-transporting ATPase subunit b
MLINWFTVVAQAINFLILVWLLKHFLYKPILNAIDTREKGIAAQLADAKSKVDEGQKERDEFQHKNRAFDQERAGLLTKATEDAKTERQHLLEQAQKDADALRAKRQQSLQTEQRNLNQDIVHWTQKEVFAIARKTLVDLANASLEERMADVFVTQLRALTGAAKDQFASSIKAPPGAAMVRCAFDLPAAQQTAIETAINETFGAKPKIQFQTVPELVSGIELSANGQKVAWSIANYLATLQESADKLLKNDSNVEPKPSLTPKPEPAAATTPAKPVVKRDPKNGPVPVAAAAKGDH